MYIVVNQRLRRYLPKDIYSSLEDPLVSRYGFDEPGAIWTADVVISGRGKDRKLAIAMENAKCGYRILLPMPSEQELADLEASIAGKMQHALSDSLGEYGIPQKYINVYMAENFYNIYFVKAKPSFPSQNVEEFAEELQQMYKEGLDPFQYDFNRRDRKFGNSRNYRSVEMATYSMLGLDDEEVRNILLQRYKS